ncbi:MAG TPA: amidohydrolase [Verrucomicrobiae bacterium]|nr:amidohydrolase [Verrucomicrobiae bacterium]
MAATLFLALGALISTRAQAADAPRPVPAAAREMAAAFINSHYADWDALYKHLHTHPELSYHEEQTSRRIAGELRGAGFEVTEKVGGFGVVGVLRNGAGPTVLLRTDLDALPVKEQTGVPYASQAMTKDDNGNEVSVMHACGHDVHMTVFSATARTLARLKDYWSGTIVMIGQPAEERGGGARKMLADGLFTRFPKPDRCVALHVAANLPAGTVGHVEGYAMANVDSVDITFRGVGGHGAWPHTTKDPVVLAAEAIMAFQTIVSRETEPGQAAVVTVGSIHGGTKHNIIPDEVKLQLTLRSYTDQVRSNTITSLQRICKNMALAAGVPEDRLPTVKRDEEEFTRALYNDPALTLQLAGAVGGWLGADKVVSARAVMGGEDFNEYGRTADKIPISLLWLGAVEPGRFVESQKSGAALPSLHSAFFAPAPEMTIKTGVTSMAAVVLELLGK